MDRLLIIGELKAIVSPYTEERSKLEELSEDTDFLKDLKINSANLVDIVLDIEEKFGIEVDNDSMAKMLTVRATVEVVEQKLSGDAGQ